MPTPRTQHFIAETNEEEMRCNLDALEQRRQEAAVRMARYKHQVAWYYNSQVRHVYFKPGDLVLRKNSVSRVHEQNKLCPTWEGPYRVIHASRTGFCKLAHLDGTEIPRTWHTSNLKIFYQ